MNTKSFFPCAGGLNLILGTGRKKQNISSENSGHCQVFPLKGGISPQLFILQEKT